MLKLINSLKNHYGFIICNFGSIIVSLLCSPWLFGPHPTTAQGLPLSCPSSVTIATGYLTPSVESLTWMYINEASREPIGWKLLLCQSRRGGVTVAVVMGCGLWGSVAGREDGRILGSAAADRLKTSLQLWLVVPWSLALDNKGVT